MPTDQGQRNAAVRLHHAEELAKAGIYLVCRECLLEGRTGAMDVPADGVSFYPAQIETFKTMVRRSGAEATAALRKRLADPARCRLLCPHHVKRAKQGWSLRREELYREWPNIADMRGAYTVVAPSGRTVQVDEYGLGPFASPVWKEQRRVMREEWFSTADGGPPPLD